jgi:flavin reductase
VRGNGRFCVNLLGDHQSEISDTFAGRLPAPGGDKFACAQWRALATGAPALEDALMALDCRLVAQLRQGSHSVFIGAVAEVALGEGAPLVYAKRAYRNLGLPLDALVSAA